MMRTAAAAAVAAVGMKVRRRCGGLSTRSCANKTAHLQAAAYTLFTPFPQHPVHPPSSSSATISLASQASESRMLSSYMNRRSVVMPSALYAPRSPGEGTNRQMAEGQGAIRKAKQAQCGGRCRVTPTLAATRTAANALQLALHYLAGHKREEGLHALGCPPLRGLPAKAATAGQGHAVSSSTCLQLHHGKLAAVQNLTQADAGKVCCQPEHTETLLAYQKEHTCPSASQPCCVGLPAAAAGQQQAAVPPAATPLPAAATGWTLLVVPPQRSMVQAELPASRHGTLEGGKGLLGEVAMESPTPGRRRQLAAL